MSQSPYRAFVCYLVCYELAVYLSVDAFLPALPEVAESFPAHAWPIAYTITAWYLGTALTPLLLGPVAERIGYRRTLFAGAAVFLSATLICTLTHHFYSFLLGRLLQGCCVAAVLTPGYGTIHHLLDQKQAIKTVAWMSAITVLAPSAGPMLGAVVLLWTDWRWIFAGLFALALLSNIGLYARMPALSRTPNDYPEQATSIWRQYGRILSAHSYLRYKASQCLLFACLIVWITTSPMLLMQTFRFDAIQFAWAQVTVFGAFIVGTQGIKHLLHRWVPTQFLRITLSYTMVCGLLTVLCAYLYPLRPWALTVAAAGMALGIGTSLSSLDRLAIECSNQPMAMRIAMGGFLFSLFGFAGSLAANIIGHTELLDLAILMCALACLANLMMATIKPKHDAAPATT